MAEKIALERLSVLPDRIEAEVRVLDPAYRTTPPELIAQVLVQFPTIPFHTCRNEAGPTFSAVMENTSLPHLLEHLVIDIQTRRMPSEKMKQSTRCSRARPNGARPCAMWLSCAFLSTTI